MTDNEILDIWDSYKRILKIHKDNVGGSDKRELVISQGVADGTYKLLTRQKEELELKQMDVNSLTSERDALQEMVEEQKAEIESLKDEVSQLKIHLMAIESAANLYKTNHDVLERALQFQKLKNETIKCEAMEDLAVKIKNELISEAKKRKPCEECQRDMATVETLELIDRVLKSEVAK